MGDGQSPASGDRQLNYGSSAGQTNISTEKNTITLNSMAGISSTFSFTWTQQPSE
ncbi:hypothetical protein [Anabaena sp. CCY 0017]|uniref:hypothetical protein n=1 Tax=Anabaena sp. CCY 0017 TaxID=3103866 RepID=UPI0039C6660A